MSLASSRAASSKANLDTPGSLTAPFQPPASCCLLDCSTLGLGCRWAWCPFFKAAPFCGLVYRDNKRTSSLRGPTPTKKTHGCLPKLVVFHFLEPRGTHLGPKACSPLMDQIFTVPLPGTGALRHALGERS